MVTVLRINTEKFLRRFCMTVMMKKLRWMMIQKLCRKEIINIYSHTELMKTERYIMIV